MNIKIEATKYCNQSCLHCSFSRKYSSDTTHLTLGALKQKIEDIRTTVGIPKKFQVTITGGEPLLNPELFEMIDFLSSEGANYVTLATNGLPLVGNPSLRTKLIDSKVNEVVVSLSTTNEDYLKIRQSNQNLVVHEIMQLKKESPRLKITGNYLIYGKSSTDLNKFMNNLSIPFDLVRFLVYKQALSPKASPLKEMSSQEVRDLRQRVRAHNKMVYGLLNVFNKFVLRTKSLIPVIVLEPEIDSEDQDPSIAA